MIIILLFILAHLSPYVWDRIFFRKRLTIILGSRFTVKVYVRNIKRSKKAYGHDFSSRIKCALNAPRRLARRKYKRSENKTRLAPYVHLAKGREGKRQTFRLEFWRFVAAIACEFSSSQNFFQSSLVKKLIIRRPQRYVPLTLALCFLFFRRGIIKLSPFVLGKLLPVPLTIAPISCELSSLYVDPLITWS